MSAVLLGVPDSLIENTTTWDTSKIGGRPDTMVDLAAPVCSKCQSCMIHILQIYCPLELSPFHRVLHVFACTTKACWNKQYSWRVFRSQLLDSNSKQETQSNQTKNSSLFPETTDWCDNADDWGCADGSQDLVFMVTGDETNSSPAVQNDLVKSRDGPSASEDPVIGQLESLDLDEDSSDTVESEVLVERDELADKEMLENALSYLATNQCRPEDRAEPEHPKVLKQSSSNVIASYYLNVFDEQECVGTDKHHVDRLLREYERKERVDVKSLADQEIGSGKGRSGSEKYEKTELQHGDKCFYNFMKRLQLCPEQVVRYQYGGSALPILRGVSPCPNCPFCGSSRVFEMQLTPPLIPFLHQQNSKEPVLEFGTVLVYTCAKSCWEESTPREEFVLVQSDPDQHLFKV